MLKGDDCMLAHGHQTLCSCDPSVYTFIFLLFSAEEGFTLPLFDSNETLTSLLDKYPKYTPTKTRTNPTKCLALKGFEKSKKERMMVIIFRALASNTPTTPP
mmetsp:Transcript_294/g.594  ORF Transcript_294/g.594 Transcript_294/m.594 type:complete len:102 (-) Transcript_294:80-385(-)